MASCWKYRDAWKPFFSLLERFWPNCPYEIDLLTDVDVEAGRGVPASVNTRIYQTDTPWCRMLSHFTGINDEIVMLFQDDFFIHAPVQPDAIDEALEQMRELNAGMVRLYPCPGSNLDYGNGHFGFVTKETPYRISCQVSLWRSQYLHTLSRDFNTPTEFEFQGTQLSNQLPDVVLAWKRDAEPWPLQYLCSGISRGRWNPDAKRLCDQYGIVNDWTMRPFAA